MINVTTHQTFDKCSISSLETKLLLPEGAGKFTQLKRNGINQLSCKLKKNKIFSPM